MTVRASVLDVENAARVLLGRNGHTTTLEIKEYMRDLDFIVYQDEVANSMYCVWAMNDWAWTFNGTYRTYYPTFEDAEAAYDNDSDGIEQTSWLGWLNTAPAPQAVPSNGGLNTLAQTAGYVGNVVATMVSSSPATPAPAPRDPIEDRVAQLQLTTKIFSDTGDWVAYLVGRDKDGNVPPALYVTGGDPTWDYDTARDTVRTFAKKYYNADYFDIRANKIK